MKSELIESPWWMRLTASPSSRATLRTLTFGQARTSGRTAMVSVINNSVSGDAVMRSIAGGDSTPWLAHACTERAPCETS